MEAIKPKFGRIIATVVVIILLLVGVVGYVGWYNFFREVPTYYESPEEHWKYGSIGAEKPEGVPYWIWMVLPRVFPDKLPGPGGYASLGAVWEEGKELPIGFTKKTIGFPRVGVNCAVCHTGTVRTDPKDKPTFILAAPTTRFNGQAYVRFLFDAANDPRFTADTILDEIKYNYDLSLFDRLLYRFIIIPVTKKALLKQEETYTWMNGRPDWGPGRTDMNPFKLRVLKLADDGSIGTTDVMALWNQKAHEGFLRHTDGLNTTLVESALAGALATGASRDSIDLESLQRIQDWLMELPPPKYPFDIDRTLASQGQKIFTNECATCHAFGQPRTGQVIPAVEVGTDRNRTDHWTQEAADAFNEYAANYTWDFNNFRASDGYVALALDGVWARAPYLHNGSIPSLQDLLENPEKRPSVFYRGYDVYDTEKVGFVSDGTQAEKVGFKYDTSVQGNSNQGHVYGTELPSEDKKALIEYLKTL
ncbi:MAG: cytochrome c [Coleofasciculus sp. S288]|nr:cytochrome c [Coleofasciculus sp. S288]